MKTYIKKPALIKFSGIVATMSVLLGCQPAPDTSISTQEAQTPMAKPTLIYPTTRQGDVVDMYFDTEVPDPYRWLEDDLSAETEAWVDAQNMVTQSVLTQIPYREKIENVLTQMYDYERVSAPFIEGDYTYFYKNDGLQNHSVLYRQRGDEAPEIFLDPNTFSADGTVSMTTVAFSRDASLVAYMTSTGGSDWRQVYVMDVETKQRIGESLSDVKFSGLSWYKNEGFYYSSYDKPTGSELSAKTDQHKVYYHSVGTPQSQDQPVFGHVESEKYRYIWAAVTEDDRYLMLSSANSTSGNKAFIKDLSQDNSDWIVVNDDLSIDVSLVTSRDNTFYVVTNADAPNRKVVSFNASTPSRDNWQDVIPQTDNVLTPVAAGDYIFAEYMVDAISKLYQYDLNGEQVRQIELPGVGSVSVRYAKSAADKTYFSFVNYTTPSTIYSLSLNEGNTATYITPQSNFDGADYVSEQVFYTSKDGTRVPMIISYHKDVKLDGTAPTMLYGYGGFDVSLTPSYSPNVAAWLSMGGIYAVPNIRGGGEYGKAWHLAGTQMQKQNVFDDFMAAAEYLITNNYTSSDKLALRGGSNGGLLVAAVMTQRPDLAAVALPAVGVLDMLRYHTFTAGAGWAYDYGTSEQSEEIFQYLLGYSPVHNVKDGVTYPATLVTTADHDDRVVPAHSYKFIAELQDHHKGDNPMLIRIEQDAGHGAGKPISKRIEEAADVFGFTLYHMGVESL